jgi:hypothetical protein
VSFAPVDIWPSTLVTVCLYFYEEMLPNCQLVLLVFLMAKFTVGEIPNGSIPVSPGGVVIPLTKKQKLTTLKLHNDYRRMQGASDMQELQWSDWLADIAKNWTQRCFFFHPDATWFPGYDEVATNENLFLGTGKFNVTVAVAQWYNADVFQCADIILSSFGPVVILWVVR